MPTALPSSLPTHVPSSNPSIAPSSVPSTIPTALPSFYCPLTPSGHHDPSSYLELAHPRLTASSGSVRAVDEEKMNKTVVSRQFGLLFGASPGSEFAFTVSLGEKKLLVGGGGGSTVKEPAAALKLVLKTATVYVESSIIGAAYQVEDAARRSQVVIDDISVELVVTLNTSGAYLRFDCEAPDSISGIGTCSAVMDPSWFSRDRTMQVCHDVLSISLLILILDDIFDPGGSACRSRVWGFECLVSSQDATA